MLMKEAKIMGIVNLTDNSYYGPSRMLGADGKTDTDKFREKVRTLLDEGADIIDIGAVATDPGTEGIGALEEWKRLEPALDVMRADFPKAEISIDTYLSEVVSRAYDKIGPFIINDISAGEADREMLPLAASLKLTYVAMHMRGTPKVMAGLTDYGPETSEFPSAVTRGVYRYFIDFENRAGNAGVEDWILDPGFGFSKTIEQNYQLLDELDVFRKFGRRILIGVSRKSMIYRYFGTNADMALPATQVLHFAALERGADILRVHDAREAKETVKLFAKLHRSAL